MSVTIRVAVRVNLTVFFCRRAKKGRRGQHLDALFGAMKGLLHAEPGYDLAAPAAPEWSKALDDRYGPERPRGTRL